MNADIENCIQNCSMWLDLQHAQPKEKHIYHDIPGKPCEVIGVNMFTLIKNPPLHCRLSQQISNSEMGEGMSADSLILECKVYLFRIWIAKEIMSDVGDLQSFMQFHKR